MTSFLILSSLIVVGLGLWFQPSFTSHLPKAIDEENTPSVHDDRTIADDKAFIAKMLPTLKGRKHWS